MRNKAYATFDFGGAYIKYKSSKPQITDTQNEWTRFREHVLFSPSFGKYYRSTTDYSELDAPIERNE